LDGNAWSAPVAEGKGNGPSTRIAFKPTQAKFIRVTLTAAVDKDTPWSIQKTRLVEAVKTPSAETQVPRIGKLAIDEVLKAVVNTKGDVQRGRQLFTELSCVSCHTVGIDEPAKGPFLGNIAKIYRRGQLAEEILKPSKTIAPGFATNVFELNDGRVVEGFILKETPQIVTIRTTSAEEHKIPVAAIEERRKSATSVMPEGLVANLTMKDLASLLDYLENLATVNKTHLLVVSAPASVRLGSTTTAEKVLRTMAQRSGDFTLDFASVDTHDRKSAAGSNSTEADAAFGEVLAEKMSPAGLRKYDGVIFLNTTGELPLPDPEAFLKWIEDGHAFVGVHAADTLHKTPGYCKMLNGKFAGNAPQAQVEVLNLDPHYVANAHLGKSITVFDEMDLLKDYDTHGAHALLEMDKHPTTKTAGHYPVSWSRSYGKGRVFYTSLGHREDVWDPTWKDGAGQRKNPPEVAEAFQKHLLGGIHWAVGLAERRD
jgi:putative heme-binding domain-containing protein